MSGCPASIPVGPFGVRSVGIRANVAHGPS